MKKMILLVIVSLGGIGAIAQTNGIQFDKSPSWTAVLKKAKAEHKFIFVDCYATWCVPCKTMDAEVYPDKNVGDIYNKDFISIKLQLDQTSNDDEQTKRWLSISKNFSINYRLSAIPTFLFFDEDGMPVHRAYGSKSREEFILLAKDALDPAKQYYSVLKSFKRGILDISDEIGLALSFIKTDNVLSRKIMWDYLNRISKAQWKDSVTMGFIRRFSTDSLVRIRSNELIKHLSKKEIYKSAYKVEFINSFINKPSDPGFTIYYHHKKRINHVMNKKGYAERAIRNAIFNQEVTPFIKNAKDSGLSPDWAKIYGRISRKFDTLNASWCATSGKTDWYEYEKDWENYSQSLIDRIELNFKDSIAQGAPGLEKLNQYAYFVFLRSNDKDKLNIALKWLDEVSEKNITIPHIIDTKANLLYKLSRKEEALNLERIAAELAPKSQSIQESYQKMNTGQPTW